MVEISKAVKLAKTFLFHRYQRILQWNSVSGKEFLQEDSADHINSKELYCEMENVPSSCNVPVWSLVLYWLTQTAVHGNRASLESSWWGFAFALPRAFAAQVLLRQLQTGSCLLPKTFIRTDCRTNEVLDTGSLSLDPAEEKQPVAQLPWVIRSGTKSLYCLGDFPCRCSGFIIHFFRVLVEHLAKTYRHACGKISKHNLLLLSVQGNNKILYTFLCLTSLTVLIGSQVFDMLRSPLEVMAFPLKHRNCLPWVAISLLC